MPPERGAAPGAAAGIDLAGFVPERTADPATALHALERTGAAILSSSGTGRTHAAAATIEVLASRLRAHRQPVDIGTNPVPGQPTYFDPATRTVNSNPATGGNAHCDGYMLYGNAYPDVVSLLCVRPAPAGGESAVLDGYRVLDAVEAADPEMGAFLRETPVEQSTPTGVPCRAPIAARAPGGRVALRCHEHQRCPDGVKPDPSAQDKIRRWHEAVDRAAEAAPRFLLGPGDLLCMDNYRVFHLRDPYSGNTRLLCRVWAWTDQAIGLPSPRTPGPDRTADIITAT